jgi:hypothetical protein
MRPSQLLVLLPITMGCTSLQAASREQVAISPAGVIQPATAGATARSRPASPIATAARHPFVGAAWKGPAPQPLPGTVRLKPNPNAAKSSIPKSARMRLDAGDPAVRPDGVRGFVELLPPPPDTADATVESRYYELPPAPER